MILRFIPSFVLGCLALILVGCNAAEAYRQALDTFSQAAALEISQDETMTKPNSYLDISSLYPAAASPAPTKQDAGYFYGKTLDLLAKALKGESQLAKLGILDNAYTLQALTQWRQGNYEAVQQTLSTMDTLPSNDNDPDDIRDEALRKALPGLINIDRAYQALQESQAAMKKLGDTPESERKAKYEMIKSFYTQYATDDSDGAPSVERAFAILDYALQDVPQNEDVYLYLLNSKLAGLDTWGDLLFNTFTASRRLSVSTFAPEEKAWIDNERSAYEARRKAMLARLEEVVGSKTHELYKYWIGVL
ncbi:MAG: hypothetical protein D6772_06105 [Bacteroidetes bacterium]|nr:MAG: hypothetical protein D6772_06105 [Bacteroidota bacterium]